MTAPRYSPGIFTGVEPDRVLVALRRDAWDPVPIHDPAGYTYPPHSHAATKLLVILRGTMEVTVAGDCFRCLPGDQVVIPVGTEHSAHIGPEGCDSYWSEQVR